MRPLWFGQVFSAKYIQEIDLQFQRHFASKDGKLFLNVFLTET